MNRLKKKIVLMVLFIAPLLLTTLGARFTAPVGAAKTWIVDDDGPADFRTIQEAINAASPGDTIFVRNGTYRRHMPARPPWDLTFIHVNKSVSLVGENRLATIIDGMDSCTPVVKVEVNNVTFRGFTVRNGSGIYGFDGGGIWLNGSSGCYIGDNVITDTQYSINLLYSSNNNVFNNIITESAVGIFERGGCSNNVISGNSVLNYTEQGKWRMHACIWVCGNYTTIVGNLFSNAHIRIASPTGLVYHNNFIDSTLDVDPSSNVTWDRDGEGSYWSDYNGTDNNGDGIGDTYLPWRGVDYYPLMSPYMLGDVNHDAVVDIRDITVVARAFGSSNEGERWNPHADLDESGVVDIRDITIVAREFGKAWEY